MIGVFGGTFDPVHLGHIKPALDVMQRLGLDELRFIPCSIPAHRTLPIATTEQRLAMLHAAIDEHQNCIIDERELNREGISYMVDTLRSLRNEFKDSTFCLIIGMDAFYGLNKWYQWQDILKLANCVVTYRPGCEFNLDTLHPDLVNVVNENKVDTEKAFIEKCFTEKDFVEKNTGSLLFMPVTQLDISATDIRQRIKQHQPINELVPTAVANIIQQQQLYVG